MPTRPFSAWDELGSGVIPGLIGAGEMFVVDLVVAKIWHDGGGLSGSGGPDLGGGGGPDLGGGGGPDLGGGGGPQGPEVNDTPLGGHNDPNLFDVPADQAPFSGYWPNPLDDLNAGGDPGLIPIFKPTLPIIPSPN
jgi:hypothetical protein